MSIDILLKFDLNICAIYFDNNKFLILFRYARALKTKYNIFTINFIWKYSLTVYREICLYRIFKYINRKFDIQVLSNYICLLEKLLNTSSIEDQNNNIYLNLSSNIEKSNLKILRHIVYCNKNFYTVIYIQSIRLLQF